MAPATFLSARGSKTSSYTTRQIPAWTISPAHLWQGMCVQYMVVNGSRSLRFRSAFSSACTCGTQASSVQWGRPLGAPLYPVASRRWSRDTIRAPTWAFGQVARHDTTCATAIHV